MSRPGRRLVLLSPFVLIAVCHLVQRLAGRDLGVWAVVPTMLVFWALIGAFIVQARGWGAFGAWLRPPRGSRFWALAGIGAGLLSLHEFLAAWPVLTSPAIFVSWLAFAAINPWFEEGYFRGLLLDAAEGWPAPLAIGYAVSLFAISHPLIWGVHSIAMRHPAALVGLCLVGTSWSVVYWRTRSLRYTVLGHILANLLGLSVPVLLNLHVPAALAPRLTGR